MNQQATYLGQRSFRSKVIAQTHGDSFAMPKVPESRSRLRFDRLSGSRTALWASWTNGLAVGRRTASVSQLRQTNSSSLMPYNAMHLSPCPNRYLETSIWYMGWLCQDLTYLCKPALAVSHVTWPPFYFHKQLVITQKLYETETYLHWIRLAGSYRDEHIRFVRIRIRIRIPDPRSWSPLKFSHLFTGSLPTSAKRFHANPFGSFFREVANWQTASQTTTKT